MILNILWTTDNCEEFGSQKNGRQISGECVSGRKPLLYKNSPVHTLYILQILFHSNSGKSKKK